MKIYNFLLLSFFSISIYSQNFNKGGELNLNERISTIDFVEVINGSTEETLFYYNNNWKVLRQRALAKNYILSYQFLQAPLTDDSEIQFLLITTYANKKQYDKREEHFQELIKSSGGLKLLNEKKPSEFRKVAFGKEPVKHLN